MFINLEMDKQQKKEKEDSNQLKSIATTNSFQQQQTISKNR